MADHQYESLTRVDVVVARTRAGEPMVLEDPDSDEEVHVGCKICELRLEEAMAVPCPGMPVERIGMGDESGP